LSNGSVEAARASKDAAKLQTGTPASFEVIASFPSQEGAVGIVSLIAGRDNNLYATTSQAGAAGRGMVLRITPAGSVSILHSFRGDSDGANPFAALVEARDGTLVGTTASGGDADAGTVFKITADGTFTVMHAFTGSADVPSPEGGGPASPLIQAHDGCFYGMTNYGGAFGGGTVFRLASNGTLTTLHSFVRFDDAGRNTGNSPLTEARDGQFYGVNKHGDLFALGLDGSYRAVHTFTGTASPPPRVALVESPDGALLGVTSGGGTAMAGNVFRISADGAIEDLRSFAGQDGRNLGAFLKARDGNFYGTTTSSGRFEGRVHSGTVFKMTDDGTITTLHRFDVATDGVGLFGLVQAADGHLYGATLAGGPSGTGTIFRVIPK
jgi:uncharacterized repeat protein (TIGR03803 family)